MKDWILPTFGTLIMWGFWGFIPKLTTQYLSPRSAIVYEVVGSLIIALIVLISLDFQPQVHPRGILLALSTGMMGFLGALMFLMAVSKGPVTLIAPLSALYPVISVLLAVFLMNESMNLRQVFGIALAVVSIMLVAL